MGHANLSIILGQTDKFTRSKGRVVMEGFLKAEVGGKGICAVDAHNVDMAVGAIQAIKDGDLKQNHRNTGARIAGGLRV